MPSYIQTIPKITQNASKIVPKLSQNGPKTAPRAKTPPSHQKDAAKTPPRRAQDTPRETQGVPRRPKTTPSWLQNPIQNQSKILLKINTPKNQTCLENQSKSCPKSFPKSSPNPLENACKNKQAETKRKITKLIYFVTSLLLTNLRFTVVKRTFAKFTRNATHVKDTPKKQQKL